MLCQKKNSKPKIYFNAEQNIPVNIGINSILVLGAFTKSMSHSGSESMQIGQKSVTFDLVNIFEFCKKLNAGKELRITMTTG